MQASQFLKNIAKLSTEDLLEIKGVGSVLAKNYTEFFQSPRFVEMLAKFENLESQNQGLEIEQQLLTTQNLPLSGQVICITGVFEQSREIIKEQLENLGASVVDNVTKQTTILLAGQKAGSKLQKAKDLGLKIVEDLDEILR